MSKPALVSDMEWEEIMKEIEFREHQIGTHPYMAPPWYFIPGGREEWRRKWVVELLIKKGYLVLEEAGENTYVCGDTYPLKDQLKTIGWWLPEFSCWKIPTQKRNRLNLQGYKVVIMPGKPKIYLKQINETTWFVKGDTYPIKDFIKKLGGTFDGRNWVLRDDINKKVEELMKIADVY